MPLRAQQLHIPFVSGLNQSVDEKIAPEGTLATAKNIRMDRSGRIVKRGAYRYQSPGDLTEATGVMATSDSVFVSNGAMVHRNSLNQNTPVIRWYPVDFAPTMHAERAFVPTDADPSYWDGAEWWDSGWGFGVFAWKDPENDTDLNYVVYDAQTRDRIGSGSISTSIVAFRGMRVVASANGIHVIYMDDTGSGGVAYSSYLAGDNAHLGVMPVGAALANSSGDLAFATAGDVNTEEIWDACAYSTGFIVAYQVEGATRIRINSYTHNGTVYSQAGTSSHNPASDLEQLALCRGSGSYVWLCRKETTASDLEVCAVTKATLVTGGYTTIRAGADSVHGLGGCELASEKTIWAWDELEPSDGTATGQYRMFWAECDTSGGGSAVGPWSVPNATPIARPFCQDGMAHIPASRQLTIFGATASVTSYYGSISRDLASDVIMSVPTSETVDYVSGTTNRNMVTALLTTGVVLRKTMRVPNSTPGQLGFVFHGYDRSLGYITYDPEQKLVGNVGADSRSFEGNVTVWNCKAGEYSHHEWTDLLCQHDGVEKVSDGTGMREAAHAHPPVILAMEATGTGGSMAVDSDYQFIAVWEWYSGGVRYQSEPSVPETVSLVGTENAVNVWVSQTALGNLGDTWRANDTKKLVLYRSLANSGGQGIFYRLRNTTTSEGVTDADQTAEYASFFVSQADADIVGNEVIYTAQSLPNQAVPGGPAAASHKGRLWTGGGLDPYRIYYSQPSSFGLPPRFNLAMYIDIPADSRVTAMASVGDVLAVFTEDSVYAVMGDGPNTLGQPVDGFRVQLVSRGTGALSQLGVVETPAGVMFVSADGLRLLNTGLQVVPVGEQVKDLFDPDVGTLVGARYCRGDETTSFVFSADSAYVVVFDHVHQVWSVDYPAVVSGSYTGAVSFDGRLHVIDTDAIVYAYDTTQLSDSKPGTTAAQYLMDFETCWLKMGKMTGFKRMWWVHLLGEAVGSHGVKLYITTNYTDGSTNQTTHSWTAAEIAALDHFELRAHLKYQRGSAFKVRAQEQAGVSPTAGFQANALGLIYGDRGTLTKMRTEASK